MHTNPFEENETEEYLVNKLPYEKIRNKQLILKQ